MTPQPPVPSPDDELAASTVTTILNREATIAVEGHIGRPGANLAGDIGIWCEKCQRAYTFAKWHRHLRELARMALTINKR